METQPIFFFVAESFTKSILADIFTFGMLVGSFWVNYEFIESKLLSAVILIMFWISATARGSSKIKKFYTKEEFKEFVKTL